MKQRKLEYFMPSLITEEAVKMYNFYTEYVNFHNNEPIEEGLISTFSESPHFIGIYSYLGSICLSNLRYNQHISDSLLKLFLKLFTNVTDKENNIFFNSCLNPLPEELCHSKTLLNFTIIILAKAIKENIKHEPQILEALEIFIDKVPLSINESSNKGLTPLIFALHDLSGDSNLVKFLIRKGANLDIKLSNPQKLTHNKFEEKCYQRFLNIFKPISTYMEITKPIDFDESDSFLLPNVPMSNSSEILSSTISKTNSKQPTIFNEQFTKTVLELESKLLISNCSNAYDVNNITTSRIFDNSDSNFFDIRKSSTFYNDDKRISRKNSSCNVQ